MCGHTVRLTRPNGPRDSSSVLSLLGQNTCEEMRGRSGGTGREGKIGSISSKCSLCSVVLPGVLPLAQCFWPSQSVIFLSSASSPFCVASRSPHFFSDLLYIMSLLDCNQHSSFICFPSVVPEVHKNYKLKYKKNKVNNS